jgi:two-component system chemotaxis sensor kinase CheA
MNSKISANALALSQKISKELHNKALSLRMQPVQGLFQRLERVIRDVARAQTKNIQVNHIGTEVELDKTVIERITDPLIHVVRNAVDHGVETVEQRAASEKASPAILTLTAQQDATDVCITISDDGRGIDPERVRNKAIEKGLISRDANLTKEELINLIFLPGFSTAEKVTDISGRGVGMDVVMKAIQALQGSIQVSNEFEHRRRVSCSRG